MRIALLLASSALLGCAPRQDPGVPLPPKSGAAALVAADLVIASQADTVSAIDTARKVVADNLSNAETTGYKALRCRVQNGRPEAFSDFDQGSLESTNRNLDVAVSGRGLLRVKVDPNLSDGFAYTRNGNFFKNNDGDLVVGMGDGYRIDPPITVPNDAVEISISQDGVVRVLQAGQTAKTTIGQIELYTFMSPERLARQGSLFFATDAAGRAIESKPRENGTGTLMQGFLEASNVNLTHEKLRADFLNNWRAVVLGEHRGR